MKVVAFLPAKGTSSRIESKNKKELYGKPLFLHTLEKLVECDFIDEVYLDSEDEEILSYAETVSCNVIRRDPSLANNNTDGNKLFWNEVKQIDADIYVQILGTSPFIKKETIKKTIEVLSQNKEYDSVVVVNKQKQYTWTDGKPNYDTKHIPNSKDLPDTIIETMGLYVIRKDTVMKNHCRIGEHPFLFECSPLEAIDINYPEDFELAELIASGLYINPKFCACK